MIVITERLNVYKIDVLRSVIILFAAILLSNYLFYLFRNDINTYTILISIISSLVASILLEYYLLYNSKLYSKEIISDLLTDINQQNSNKILSNIKKINKIYSSRNRIITFQDKNILDEVYLLFNIVHTSFLKERKHYRPEQEIRSIFDRLKKNGSILSNDYGVDFISLMVLYEINSSYLWLYYGVGEVSRDNPFKSFSPFKDSYLKTEFLISQKPLISIRDQENLDVSDYVKQVLKWYEMISVNNEPIEYYRKILNSLNDQYVEITEKNEVNSIQLYISFQIIIIGYFVHIVESKSDEKFYFTFSEFVHKSSNAEFLGIIRRNPIFYGYFSVAYLGRIYDNEEFRGQIIKEWKINLLFHRVTINLSNEQYVDFVDSVFSEEFSDIFSDDSNQDFLNRNPHIITSAMILRAISLAFVSKDYMDLYRTYMEHTNHRLNQYKINYPDRDFESYLLRSRTSRPYLLFDYLNKCNESSNLVDPQYIAGFFPHFSADLTFCMDRVICNHQDLATFSSYLITNKENATNTAATSTRA